MDISSGLLSFHKKRARTAVGSARARLMAGRRSPRSLKRYLHVTGDRATPNSNRFPDATNRNPADGLLPRRDVLSFGSSQAGSVHAVASIQNNSGPSQGLAGRPAAG